MHSRRQQGTALLLAILLTAIAAMISVFLISQRQIDINRTRLTQQSTQAYWYSQGVLSWAKAYLIQNAKQGIVSPINLPQTQHANTIISGQLVDAEGRFNLNSLVKPNSTQQFYGLLQAVAPNISSQQAILVASSIRSWLSSAPNVQDKYYLAQGYACAHQPMVDASELRLVRGVDPKLYQRLKPYVVALSNSAALNINSASLPLLMSLGLNRNDARAVLLIRQQHHGFRTVAEFIQLPQLAKYRFTTNKLTVHSRYYLLQANYKQGQQQLHFTWLLQYLGGLKPRVNVVWAQG